MAILTNLTKIQRGRYLKSLIAAAVSAFTFLSALSLPAAQAEYLMYVPGIPAAPGVSDAGQLETFYMTYDQSTEKMVLVLRFLPAPGTNAVVQGFTMVISDGPMPAHDGELIMFYADFTDLTSKKLLAYAYGEPGRNNSHFDGSRQAGVQPPDLIASTLVNGSFVTKYDVIDNPGDNSRTIELHLNGVVLNAHSPLYPTSGVPFAGINVGPSFGMWFYPVSVLSTQYNGDGKITKYSFLKQGNYDVTGIPMYTRPECKSTPAQPVTVGIGQLFQGSVLGTDEGFGGNLENLTVSYSGLPPGAATNPANNSTATPPVVAKVDWTPQPGDEGSSYTINVKFKDTVGLDVSCPLTVNVPPNRPPVCQFSQSAYVNDCEGLETTIDIDASGSGDPDAHQTPTYSWQLNCNDPAAVLVNANTLTPTVKLSAPGLGSASNCTLTLTMDDGQSQTSCEALVEVPACEVDCLGNPNGNATVDACGVCDGDGTSCADCLGNPNGNAKLDRCGVCEGDGLSCVECVDSDNTQDNNALDGLAHEQFQVNRRIGRALRLLDRGGKETKRFVRDRIQESKSYRNNNWVVAWTVFPTVVKTCKANPFCVQADNSLAVSEYDQNASALLSIGEQLLERYNTLAANKTGKAKSKRGRKFRRVLNGVYGETQLIASSIPGTYTCDNP